ncbi:MAG: hypothetical protein EP320_00600 [Rhodobacteraceae bacterium]|nr:MAG: hypothetical protein EP320_00600 [Paracoccaceae bacterium]
MKVQDLVTLAKAYKTHRGLKMSSLGAYSANDGKFFTRLEQGGGCTIKTAQKVIDWFDQNWPADLEWPHGLERPSTKRSAA